MGQAAATPAAGAGANVSRNLTNHKNRNTVAGNETVSKRNNVEIIQETPTLPTTEFTFVRFYANTDPKFKFGRRIKLLRIKKHLYFIFIFIFKK